MCHIYIGSTVTASAAAWSIDGHGGKDVSKYMKKHFYQAFVEASASDSSDNKENNSNNSNSFVKSALKKALHSVDQDILTGPVSKSLHYQGCTSCMVYLDKLAAGSSSSLTSSVLSANVGDSRAVLARGVKAVDLTEDHKPNLPSERDRGESVSVWRSLLYWLCNEKLLRVQYCRRCVSVFPGLPPLSLV